MTVELESRACAEAEHEEVRNKERVQIQRIIDQTAIRSTAQVVFETSCQSVINILESDKGTISTIQKFQLQLEEAFKECKRTNKELLYLLTKESAESEIRWIHDIQRRYNRIIEKLDVQIAKDEQLKELKQAIKEKTTNLSLEKIKLPKFEGEIREYRQFKRDFQGHVEPTLDKGDVSYVLRSCLGEEPYETVKSVDDDVNEMWKRLDDKYGDPAKVADVIIDSIRRTKIIRDGEHKQLVEFVNMLEDG